MKKIKLLKWRVELSCGNTFVFRSITQAADFMAKAAINNAGSSDDILNFRLIPCVEFEEEVEPIYCDTDSIKEADRMKFKQMLNEEYGRACSDMEVIEYEKDVHQD